MWNDKITPMLLDEREKPFNSSDYIFELKFDGARALAYVTKTGVKIMNRHLMDITYLYPELQNLKHMVSKNTIFDGEITCFMDGKPSFSKLQERAHLKNTNKIKSQMNNNPAVFICFDILYEGKDLTNLELIKRKDILNKYSDNDYFVKTFYVENEGIKLFKEVQKQDLEGIVAKLKNSPYETNKRSKSWIKIKNLKAETFYIGGYFFKEETYVFSVVLGEFINKEFCYAGKVFIAKKNPLFKVILNEKKIKSPFKDYEDDSVNFINPKYKCSVKYMERTKNNHLRQPFYVKEEK